MLAFLCWLRAILFGSFVLSDDHNLGNKPNLLDMELQIVSPFAVFRVAAYVLALSILQCVQPHLGRYRAYGALLNYFMQGIPSLMAISGFNTHALWNQIALKLPKEVIPYNIYNMAHFK